MRAVLIALCTLLIIGGASAADERIYRWTGHDGKVHYGDLPPPGAREVRNFDRKVGTAAPTEPADHAPPSAEKLAEQEAECANKRAQLNTYRNATRLVERDALGREREFTLAEREQIIARTQADLETRCGDAPQE